MNSQNKNSALFAANTLMKVISDLDDRDKVKFIIEARKLYTRYGRGLLSVQFESPQKACEFMFKMRGKEAKFPHIEYMLLDVFIEGSGGVTDILIENLKKYNPKKQTIILIEIHEENTGGVVYRQIVLENEEFPMTRKPEDVDIKITGLRSCEIGTHVPEEADIKIIGLHWE